MRRTIGNFGRKALIAALPLAVAVTFAGAGTATAEAPAVAPQTVVVSDIAQPVAPVAVQPAAIATAEEIATNPNAANHDPLGNGAAAGAIVGAAFGAVMCALPIVTIPLIPLCIIGPAFQGALVGLIVGAVAPDVIPQVLP